VSQRKSTIKPAANRFTDTWILLKTLAAGALGCGVQALSVHQPIRKETVVNVNSAFALELYGQVCNREGNLFLSPYSISTVLAMTYAGASGPTAEQMAKTLHLSDQQQLHAAFAALNQDVTASGRTRGYQLYTANALWGQKGYNFLSNFLDLIQVHCGAAVKQLDFKSATEDARRTINTWVENQTQDKIKDLVPPGILDSETRLVLTNAIYFKGNWASQFKKERTQNEDFWITADQKIPVSMMHQTTEFKYLDEKEFQALEMPYAGDRLAMVILLPHNVDGLAEFERKLKPEKLAEWLARLHREEVQVALPNYQLAAQLQLSDALSRMGMPLAFHRGEADFSRMDGTRDLFLTAVVHKALVDVNEEGTEVAAATVSVKLLAGPPRQRMIFRADHPFIFLIRDTRSGVILFMGRLSRPGQ
jgi:serpin B